MQKKLSEIRIIAGVWRSRKLRFYNHEGLRPTLSHVRETVFNWLQFEIANKNVLDLFAGSGALGFEALSRGAAKATFVELEASCAKQLKASAADLQATSANIECVDALSFLTNTQERFNLVFLDPPFHQNLLDSVMPALDNKLDYEAIIYVEHEKHAQPSIPSSWRCLKQKKAKEFCLSLYKKTKD